MVVHSGNKVEIIKMVDNAMKVLDVLRESDNRLGVNEIAKSCELNPSTTFRILKTLEQSGWVFQLNDGRYIIGQKIGFVTEKNNFYLALREIASVVMEKCVEEQKTAMNLMVREGSSCIIIEQVRTKNIIDYVPPVNSRLPVYACAGGKILLSELPVNLVELIIENTKMEPLTAYTIKTPEEFWKVLRETAKKNYAFDFQESIENGSCVAVPIRDNEGTIIAALSFSGFIGIKETDQLLKYVPILNAASQKITEGLYRCEGKEHSETE